MKKLILVAFLSVLMFSVSAQSRNKSKKTADKVTTQVSTSDQLRQLAIQLQLNEGQYIRFREVNRARAAQIDEIKSLYPNDPAAREAKINDINKQYDAQLAQSLTPKQFTAFLQASGRPPVTTNTNLEATGYGGRAIETTIMDSVAKPTIKIDKDTLNN